MAGPGGGPPRRSHTKSRMGCAACKRRHIRCDENRPQCKNCTKHKVRCPYQELSPSSEESSPTPEKPDLMWTTNVQNSLEQWRKTNNFPFSNLHLSPAPQPSDYTDVELRLLHHLASICDELTALEVNSFTIWTRQIPTIMQIGVTHRYVMHSLFSFAAMHISYMNDCPLVSNIGYEHRGIALTGLKEAINSFSRETADAILAASLVLSWQATDWRSWTQLMQGTRAVIEAMVPWKNESQFTDFIDESVTFPTAPPSPTLDHKPNMPRPEDYDAYKQTLLQLQQVEAEVKANKQDAKSIHQLILFLKSTKKIKPDVMPVAEQFDRLRPLRAWLFWLPVTHLKRARASANSLVVIAHYYTVAMVMERLFPEIGAAYFGSLSIRPLEDISRRLLSMINHDQITPTGLTLQDGNTPMLAVTPATVASAAVTGMATTNTLKLMEYPIDTITVFRTRMGWVQPKRTHSFPQYSPPNFPIMDTAAPEPLMPYTDSSGLYAYSNESLSLITPECVSMANMNHSPLVISSPFPGQPFLNIPSPCYSGYSPASSTADGSGAYSDSEDFSSYDLNNLQSMSAGMNSGFSDCYVNMGPGVGNMNTSMMNASYGAPATSTTTISGMPNIFPPTPMTSAPPTLAISTEANTFGMTSMAPSPYLIADYAALLPLPDSPYPGNSPVMGPNRGGLSAWGYHSHHSSISSIPETVSVSLSDEGNEYLL